MLVVRRVVSWTVVTSALVGLSGACGHSSTSGGPSSADIGSFCSTLSSEVRQCAQPSACEQALAADCSTYAQAFSAAYLTASESCDVACSDGGENDCFIRAVIAASAPLTAAQRQVQADFCKVCPDGSSVIYGPACSQFYPGEEGGLGFAGGALLAYSDALVTTVDQQCTGAPAASPDASDRPDCVQTFIACAASVIDANAGLPPACAQAGDAGSGL
jgi:hypothetical protein